MNPTATPAKSIVISHLGVSLGNEERGRIIALPTSEVFYNQKLISSFLQVPASTLDNGFQAHLYTRPADTLVVYLRDVDKSLIQQTSRCISVNADIWKSLTGISLAENHVVIAGNHTGLYMDEVPTGIRLRQGTLINVAVRLAAEENKAILAFVFNEHFLQEAGLNFPENSFSQRVAQTTSLLMDKNRTIQLLQKNNVPVPVTYFSEKKRDTISKNGKYVFKPSGGAAGLGIYSNEGKGASWNEIQLYIRKLEENHLLPENYQIQEYLPGPVAGALVLFYSGRRYKILQIHNQTINRENRFTGGYWSLENEKCSFDSANKLVQKIAAIKELNFAGLMGLDIIDGKIIEINPRITASSPVSHMRTHEKEIGKFWGSDFNLKRIDINTSVSISQKMVESGWLKMKITELWRKYKVLILPQGLNPVGNSRVVFINDDHLNTVQKEFLKRIEIYSTN